MVSNVSMYQRMSSTSVGVPCWTRASAQGSSRTTSRRFAQVLGYAVRERPGVLMDYCAATTEPYDRGIASRAIRSLADFQPGLKQERAARYAPEIYTFSA